MKKATPNQGDVISVLTLRELCHFCSVDADWVVELIDHGVVEPVEHPQSDITFEAVRLRAARDCRLGNVAINPRLAHGILFWNRVRIHVFQ